MVAIDESSLQAAAARLLFYIHQIDRVSCCSGCTVMTGP